MLDVTQHSDSNQDWPHRAGVLVARTLGLMGAFAVAFLPPLAYANPQGGVVSGGAATITSNGKTLDVTQTSNSAVIDWRSFNIGADELTAFHQPSASAMAFNRVNDVNPSQILGQLTANGRIVLVNPNGVFFGAGSRIDVNGLIATTANISNSDFMAGRLNFSQAGNPAGSIINQGTITAQQAGLVGFVAPNVGNGGLIQAQLGKVTLASGDTFTLDLAGDKLISVAVSGDLHQQIVNNSGIIQADGGKIVLTAAAARGIVDSVISNSGIIQANRFQQKNGKIILYAEGSNAVKGNVAANKGQLSGSSTVINSGILSATGYGVGETGGSISVLGDNIAILNGSIIDASGDAGGGYIKIGGDFHGAGTTPTALNTYVDANALIMANANTSGNGGNVAVWADNNTWFSGNILAEGGKNSGDGGFVETSGHDYLNANGYVDLTAPKGNKGTYLLDPATIAIYGNVTPAFNATDSSISLSSALKLWLDASDTANVNLTYNSLGTTATGTSGQNTITVSANTSLVVGARIRLGGAGSVTAANTVGADTYTISAISGTTITLSSNLTSSYAGSGVYEGYVSQLTDKSGQANNATQATGSAMPLWISNGQNGIGVASFNGSGDYLQSTSNIDLTSAYSVFYTSAVNAARNYNGIFRVATNGIATNSLLEIYWQTGSNSGNIATAANRGGSFLGYSSNNALPTVGNYGIASTITSNGSTSSQFYDSTTRSVDTTFGSGTYLPATAGAYYVGVGYGGDGVGTDGLNGKISELFAYNTAISTNARNLIEQYQAAKWGIALTPPGTGATEAAKAMASDGYSVFTTRYLERLSSSANIVLSATGAVTLDLQGDNMSLTAVRNLSITSTGGNITSNSSGTITTSQSSGSGGNITFSAGTDIALSGLTLNSNGGAIILDANTAGAGGAISLTNSSALNSSGGNITLGGGGGAITAGTGYAVGDSTYVQGVLISGATLNAGGGNIIVNGAGPTTATACGANAAAGGFRVCGGVEVRNGSTIQTTGTGAIDIYGTGGILNGNANVYSDGVFIGGSSGTDNIEVDGSGHLNIIGTGAPANTSNRASVGVEIGYSTEMIQSTSTSAGAGNITITGSSSGVNSYNYAEGAALDDSGATVSTKVGNITFTGTATGALSTNFGVEDYGTIKSMGSGNITLTANAANATNNYQITANAFTVGDNADTGNITITADSFANMTSPTIKTAGVVTFQPYTASTTIGVAGGAGTLQITQAMMDATNAPTINIGGAAGSAGTSGLITTGAFAWESTLSNLNLVSNAGVTIAGALTDSAKSGNLTVQAATDIIQNSAITASGGKTLNVFYDADYALGGGAINVAAGITSNGGNVTMGGGTGTISAGSGYAVGDATYMQGIYINGTTISSGAGNIIMNGTGWSDNATTNHEGVLVKNAGVIQSTSGSITLNGQGGSGNTNGGFNGNDVGIYIADSGSKMSSSQGAISLTGTGGAGSALYQEGITIDNSGKIESTGSGGTASTITLNGTGANDGGGVIVESSGSINSVDGAISLTGTGSGSGNDGFPFEPYNGNILTTGSANITLNLIRTGGGPADFRSSGSNHTIGGASATGNIRVNSDTLVSFDANIPVFQTTGNVLFAPRTASTAVGVAGGAGTLGITSSILGATTAGSITIGSSSDTAAMTVGAYTWGAPVTLNNGSGKIEFAGIQTLGANSLTAVTSSGNIQIDQGDKIVSTASSGNSIVLASGGNFINNDTNDGSSALSPGSGTARYLVYSADPSLNSLSGLSDAGKHVFNKTYAGYAPGSVTQTGNQFLYSLAPTITVTANNASRLYGAADPSFTPSYSGFVDGDTSSILSGSASFSTPGGDTATSAAGSTYTITASNNTLANSIGYTFTAPVNGTLTVNKAHLTVAANNASRLYGAADPSFTDTITGFANGETSAVVSGSASNTTPGGDTATSAAGSTYAITAAQGTLSASNYDFTTFNAGTLTVNKAHLTVAANNASRLYGAADPSFTDTITGFANGETSAVVSGAASNTTPGGDTATSAAGSTYAITPTQGTLSASNYDFTTFNAGTLTVNKAHLTVAANNASRLYGAADPSFTDTITGFANGETSAVVSGAASNTTPGGDTATSAAGSTYAITAAQGTLSASNYDFTTFNAGTLTVNKAHLTVTANNASRLYGAADPSFTDTITGFANGETSAVVSGSASNTTPGGDTATSAAGSTYAITAAQGTLSASNYDFTVFNAGTLTVNKAHLTVAANNASRLYGAADPSFTDTITGFANGETSAVVSGSASNTTPGGDTATSAAGSTYAITAAQGTLSASNYDFTVFNAGTLTVNKAHLTVTADNKSMTYGGSSLPTLTDTISGFVNGENSGVVSGSAALSTGATAYNGTAGSGSNAGGYAITPALGTLSASNYDFTVFNAGTLTVNKALLTVSATPGQKKTFGAPDPISFAFTNTGLVNGDSSASFTGALGRVAGENTGTYAINQNTLAATGNYTITAYIGTDFTIATSVTPSLITTYRIPGPIIALPVTSAPNTPDPNITIAAPAPVASTANSVDLSGPNPPSNPFTVAAVQGDSIVRPATLAARNAGTYAANDNGPTATRDFTIASHADGLAINPETLAVTAPDAIASFNDVTGRNVGTFAANDNGMNANRDYVITHSSDNLYINPAALVMADESVVYGSVIIGGSTTTNSGTYAISRAVDAAHASIDATLLPSGTSTVFAERELSSASPDINLPKSQDTNDDAQLSEDASPLLSTFDTDSPSFFAVMPVISKQTGPAAAGRSGRTRKYEPYY